MYFIILTTTYINRHYFTLISLKGGEKIQKMSELKKARMKLYEVIETGSRERIIEASRELDKIIVKHMHSQLNKKNL